jgi:exodeoxyribonuclease VII small subunit
MPSKKPPATEQTFEQALQRLEKIVEQLEQGEIPLEESMRLYEEGIGLSKICAEKLNQAELKLKKLGRDMEGNLKLFDEEPEE